jgi:hypothetical protein
MRDDNYRRGLADDERFLMRSRAYLGIREIADPFRFGIEFQDSRQFGTELPELNRDADEADLLQGFGELYFNDALGRNRPARIQAGRMSFDYVDRRLIARNRFRNTTNAFDGFRVQLGQRSNDWQFDFFAVQPVDRQVLQFDHPDEERWLYGIIPAWRRWSEVVTFEPYYLILDEDRKDRDRADRELHTMGLHAYGPIGETGFDYDVDAAYQFGENGDLDVRAFAAHGEIGYAVKHAWKPRVSVAVNYATGDRDPDDSRDGRFNPLFGASKTMYSFQNLIAWQNVINPTLQISARPTDKLQLTGVYRTFWLASDNDAFVRAGLVDPTGDSGRYVGQEIDLQVNYQFDRRVGAEVGYAYFLPGTFTSKTGGDGIDDADFFYVQMVLRF